MNPLALSFALLAAVVVSASDGVRSSVPFAPDVERDCPAEHPRSAARVRIFLTNPLLPELRNRFDLGTASADDVRLLDGADDRETCAALWNALEETADALASEDQVTFYRSGDRFLVPITRYRPAQPGVVRLDGPGALHVYDAEYRLIGRFAT